MYGIFINLFYFYVMLVKFKFYFVLEKNIYIKKTKTLQRLYIQRKQKTLQRLLFYLKKNLSYFGIIDK